MTPRLGLTDPTLHTGLTPFLQGEAHPTVSSILGSSTIDGSKPSPGFQALLKAEPIPATAAAPNVDGARKAARRSESADPKSGGDDEKRRQFLERNRVAALKCRQRKKQQLNELQRRHDYMIYENERLKNEYLQLRDKALHIKTLLEAHRECSVAQANGVFGIDSLPPGTPNISSQPIVFALPDGVQSEKLKEIISAIPPTSNGVPINGVDTVSGRPQFLWKSGASPQSDKSRLQAGIVE
ncbi:Transcription factor [Linderina macrospora]|uniref:Transcription factor n=1 Tax=Linderina macrospora TaxID=4868 RepID=A0ACC1JGD9_9FUNG|nr:Transcription factor [Linderina macrospora]